MENGLWNWRLDSSGERKTVDTKHQVQIIYLCYRFVQCPMHTMNRDTHGVSDWLTDCPCPYCCVCAFFFLFSFAFSLARGLPPLFRSSIHTVRAIQLRTIRVFARCTMYTQIVCECAFFISISIAIDVVVIFVFIYFSIFHSNGTFTNTNWRCASLKVETNNVAARLWVSECPCVSVFSLAHRTNDDEINKYINNNKKK